MTVTGHISSDLRANHISILRSRYIDKKGKNMSDNKNQLREDAITFAIAISDVCDKISGCSVYTTQLIRASSSIGANLHEARYAQSRADFVHKLEIALKECHETEYWIELLFRKNKFNEDNYQILVKTAGSIRRGLIASITTAKSNQ